MGESLTATQFTTYIAYGKTVAAVLMAANDPVGLKRSAMIEKSPLAKVNEAYARMTSGKAQFRVVLTM